MRLIDYDAAVDRYYAEWDKKDICDGAQDRDWLKQCIDDAPTIDPKDLQPRGKWKGWTTSAFIGIDECGDPRLADRRFFRCSKCDYGNVVKTHYCPNCGALMSEEAREKHDGSAL